MSYNVDPINVDCYEGTTCLINKLDIHDENALSKLEAIITFAKSSELEANPLGGNFDFEHYKNIHRFLFEDLYDWAGEIRTINISKKGTVFANPTEINQIANACFNRLADNNYFKDLNTNDFIDEIVDFYCVTNMLHPFREGNGRTQRIFLSQLIRLNGYEINFADIDADYLMISTIQSANGVTDSLKKIFTEAIKKQ